MKLFLFWDMEKDILRGSYDSGGEAYRFSADIRSTRKKVLFKHTRNAYGYARRLERMGLDQVIPTVCLSPSMHPDIFVTILIKDLRYGGPGSRLSAQQIVEFSISRKAENVVYGGFFRDEMNQQRLEAAAKAEAAEKLAAKKLRKSVSGLQAASPDWAF
ncbi:MAG: hypothetical protein M1492_07860 [Gammaproteobacteria bacterium]|nr:hypothetical protein [Gammaproteobacteria bacterium]